MENKTDLINAMYQIIAAIGVIKRDMGFKMSTTDKRVEGHLDLANECIKKFSIANTEDK